MPLHRLAKLRRQIFGGAGRVQSRCNIKNGRSAAGSYDFREENGMWTVYDCRSGYAAALNGVPQVGLGLNEADDVAAVLNRVETRRVASRISSEAWHWPDVVSVAENCSEVNGLNRRRTD